MKKFNLYVTGFPNTWDEENLKSMFGAYGPIHSIKVGMDCPTYRYAFVCYENFEHCQNARAGLNQIRIEGRNIDISPYEIKELLQLQIEDK
jgi:RNA recognition motif-containing protein